MLECFRGMEPPTNGSHELEMHLERQMRAQERQLAWTRLGISALGALIVGAFILNGTAGLEILLGAIGVLGLWSVAVFWLLRGYPAREVGIVSTFVDMAAVTTAVYAAPAAVDLYLFYGLVILGAALRFGLGASVWSSVVMSAMYLAVVLVRILPETPDWNALGVRVAYLLGVGVVAGLFSRIVIGRATENARLQARLGEEERQREMTRERELLSRLGRDFGASLDRAATLQAVAVGASGVLGGATIVFTVDEDRRRLEPAAAAGPDTELVEAWRTFAAERRPRLGEGEIGAAAATTVTREARGDEIMTGDPDGMRALGLDWLVAVPVLAAGRLHAVLATGARADRPYSNAMCRMAEAVADRAGPALQNAQLWSDLQDRMAREQVAQRIKDDFLSIVSHELRTPLTSIQGYSQLLEARLRSDLDAETKEMAHLRVIRSQVGRMRRLVDDLLDVSRIDRRGGVSIEPADFDLADEVREAAARVAREHPDRTISVDVSDSLPVHGDHDRLAQVLSNLLENAIKYSPDGGPVEVTAERRGAEVEVRVADAGIGISPEHRENVFERFYQADSGDGSRRFGGLGLGLYISRAIIDAHGGRIWSAANEAADRGSVFGFRIPRVALPLAPAGFAPTGEPPAFVVRRRES